jgi:hypothetical protein
VNFVQAACVFAIYTFATLLGYIIHTVNTLNGDIDPQEIVVIALYVLTLHSGTSANVRFGSAAVFSLFTAPLLLSHIHLMWKGQTTVESMQARHLKEKEGRALADAFGFWQIMYVQRFTFSYFFLTMGLCKERNEKRDIYGTRNGVLLTQPAIYGGSGVESKVG